VPAPWLLGAAVPCGGSVGTSCVWHREALDFPHGGHPCKTLLPAPGHLHPAQPENLDILRVPNS